MLIEEILEKKVVKPRIRQKNYTQIHTNKLVYYYIQINYSRINLSVQFGS